MAHPFSDSGTASHGVSATRSAARSCGSLAEPGRGSLARRNISWYTWAPRKDDWDGRCGEPGEDPGALGSSSLLTFPVADRRCRWSRPPSPPTARPPALDHGTSADSRRHDSHFQAGKTYSASNSLGHHRSNTATGHATSAARWVAVEGGCRDHAQTTHGRDAARAKKCVDVPCEGTGELRRCM